MTLFMLYNAQDGSSYTTGWFVGEHKGRLMFLFARCLRRLRKLPSRVEALGSGESK